MKLFIAADIHGHCDVWLSELDAKGFDVNDPNHKLVLLGDIFDRGDQALKLQQVIMDFIAKDRIILIKGNHELLALDLIDNYIFYNSHIEDTHHFKNGTFKTLMDLTQINSYEESRNVMVFQTMARRTDYIKHIIPKMLNYYETDKYVFVHSWVPLKNDYSKFNYDWRNASDDEWAKATWTKTLEAYMNKLYLPDKTIVCGHWTCADFWEQVDPIKYRENGPNARFDTFATDELIVLDACTTRSKKVNVLVVDE